MLSRCNQLFDFVGVELEFYQDENKTFWLHGATLCDILKLSNPTETIQRYVDEDWRSKKQANDKKGRKSWFIREPGFYQLAFASNTQNAKRFQKWVFEEILPTIRRDGGYISEDATNEQLATMRGRIAELEAKLSVINNNPGLNSFVTLMAENLTTPASTHQVKANAWLDRKMSPLFPSTSLRGKFVRAVSDLHRSTYMQLPKKLLESIEIDNYGTIDVKANLYTIPRDTPILEHAYEASVQWCIQKGETIYAETDKDHYPYKR